ncbi:MAG TPA: AAA family ATPase [Pyrinomonadaceae bacterium]|nr:AAA family ATPase [Pyrinomonadaceae bacterium]
MRIAVSGTHCTGKSTMIDEFLRAHPEFTHEPEPYTVMVEDLGEEFAEEPSVEDFYRQLEFNIDRLQQHAPGERVIYERCPLDFLAYIDALDPKRTNTLLDRVSDAMQNLDLIVYLPLDDTAPDSEYPKLQKAVDRRLSAIFRDDEFGVLSSCSAAIVEASGSTAKRLRIIESHLVQSNTQPGDVSQSMTS